MKTLSLHVETLGFEASENDVIDELLAQDGVLAAQIDLDQETLDVAYDERKTTKHALIDQLRFFGLAPRAAVLAAR